MKSPAKQHIAPYLLQMEQDQSTRGRRRRSARGSTSTRTTADAHGSSLITTSPTAGWGTERAGGDRAHADRVYHVTANLPKAKAVGGLSTAAAHSRSVIRMNGGSPAGDATVTASGCCRLSDTYSRPPRASDGCVVLTNQVDAISGCMQISLTSSIISNLPHRMAEPRRLGRWERATLTHVRSSLAGRRKPRCGALPVYYKSLPAMGNLTWAIGHARSGSR